jgi:hypothetical protein
VRFFNVNNAHPEPMAIYINNVRAEPIVCFRRRLWIDEVRLYINNAWAEPGI